MSQHKLEYLDTPHPYQKVKFEPAKVSFNGDILSNWFLKDNHIIRSDGRYIVINQLDTIYGLRNLLFGLISLKVRYHAFSPLVYDTVRNKWYYSYALFRESRLIRMVGHTIYLNASHKDTTSLPNGEYSYLFHQDNFIEIPSCKVFDD